MVGDAEGVLPGVPGHQGYQGWTLLLPSPGEAEVLAHSVVRGCHPGPRQQQVLALLPTCPSCSAEQGFLILTPLLLQYSAMSQLRRSTWCAGCEPPGPPAVLGAGEHDLAQQAAGLLQAQQRGQVQVGQQQTQHRRRQHRGQGAAGGPAGLTRQEAALGHHPLQVCFVLEAEAEALLCCTASATLSAS